MSGDSIYPLPRRVAAEGLQLCCLVPHPSVRLLHDRFRPNLHGAHFASKLRHIAGMACREELDFAVCFAHLFPLVNSLAHLNCVCLDRLDHPRWVARVAVALPRVVFHS